MAERQFGPYRLVRQIAVGGMAEIHLAKTKGIAGFEKYVALKMIHPNLAEDEQFIEMLVDEAKIAVQLTHANIAQTFDLGRVGDTYYITMEYIDGADLYKILRRASETDIEMPLDVCAFVGKEMLTALDHAHRKRDHSGKALGIVHRDVSPQNVLISYAGEVKLVDFGIAKATSKAKQTAAGVIKGKYYYMSPEQSWGDPIDHRSDIFSAGIVIYEMMTGQMLYLEEDLQKLLEMVRKADIAPPSRLRKGIPPQLERIIMHALAKVPGERYQSAGDFATDLERFLHGYAPAFTASKVAGESRPVLGDPAVPPVDQEDPEIEMRDGGMSTQELDASKLAHASEELERDENSMIFSLAELNASVIPPTPPTARPAPQPQPKQPTGPIRTTPRQPTAPLPSLKPAMAPPAPAPTPPARAGIQPSPIKHVPIAKPAPLPRLAKPRMPDEETRELAPKDLATTTAASSEDIGLLGMTVRGPGLAAPRRPQAAIPMSMPDWDASETQPGTEGVDDLDDLDNVGERTMITAPDFMRGSDDDEGDGATMITTRPTDDREADDAEPPTDDDDGPTMQREFVATPSRRLPAKAKAPGPAALAAKIQTPAVSALRTPRPRRRRRHRLRNRCSSRRSSRCRSSRCRRRTRTRHRISSSPTSSRTRIPTSRVRPHLTRWRRIRRASRCRPSIRRRTPDTRHSPRAIRPTRCTRCSCTAASNSSRIPCR
ncbi:MAG: serine/threonine-protein kinase [Proteobacteria bacterium]|nr:serine/threonine-protein kinase [Pseudomonadota bacterium]